jgi:hypothetical protein
MKYVPYMYWDYPFRIIVNVVNCFEKTMDPTEQVREGAHEFMIYNIIIIRYIHIITN